MAQANKVEVQIVAVDEASPKIDKLTKKIDGLESDEARIIVTSNIERIDQQLSDALYTLHQLDGDEATVQARLVGGLEDDLIAAKKLFDQLDGETGTVKLNTSGATQGLNEINKSAESSRGALANMIGNATQDLGAMAGVAGSAGVAIGQLGERAADARFAGEGLGSALKSMALVAGPIAAIAFGTQLLAKHIAEAKAREEELRDAIKEVTQELIKAQDAGEDFATTLGKLAGSKADEFLEGLGSKTDDVHEAFATLGIDYADLVRAFETGQGPIVDAIRRLHDFEEATKGVPLDQLSAAEERWADQHGISADQMHRELDALRLLDSELKKSVDLQKVATAEAKRTAAFRATATTSEREQIENTVAESRALENVRQSRAASNRELEAYLGLLSQRHDEAVDEQKIADATDRHYDALARLNTEAERVDRAKLLAKESDAARAATTQYEDLFATLNEQAARLQLQEAFARATEQLADAKTTALEAQSIISDLKLDVARFADEFKVPFPLTVDVLAKIDTGRMTEAEKTVLGYIPPKAVVVPIVPRFAAEALAQGVTADQLERLAATATPAQRAGTAGNVMIINPPGTPAATVDNLNTFLARNGSR